MCTLRGRGGGGEGGAETGRGIETERGGGGYCGVLHQPRPPSPGVYCGPPRPPSPGAAACTAGSRLRLPEQPPKVRTEGGGWGKRKKGGGWTEQQIPQTSASTRNRKAPLAESRCTQGAGAHSHAQPCPSTQDPDEIRGTQLHAAPGAHQAGPKHARLLQSINQFQRTLNLLVCEMIHDLYFSLLVKELPVHLGSKSNSKQ